MSPPSDRPEASNGSCNPSTVSSTSDLAEPSHLPDPERRYETRPIHYRSYVRDILYHHGGGSSPLLGICNSLLLAGKIQLDIPTGTGQVSENYLISLLEDQITTNYPVFMQEESMRSFVRHSLMSFVYPITLNVNFKSTKAFGDPGENVLAVVIFQLCNVPLFHGWVVDPQEIALSEAVDNKSHDSLKAAFGEYTSRKQAGLDYSVVEHDKWNLILEFLYGNSLTSHGLSCLREDLSEQEIGVLFWRNQFSTMMKLQTDVGFISANAVWLRVDEVNYSLEDYMTCCFVPLGKEVSMTLSAGENELFLLKLLLNLRALVAYHTPIWICPFFQLVGKMILAESDDTKRDGYLNTLMGDLEQQEICTFYQSVFKMIQAEPDNTNSEEYLKRLMSFFKEELVMDHLPSEPPDANKVSERTYKTRQIHFEGRLTHIVYQEDDGPCALLGICNSLLLTDKIRLDVLNDMGEVSENYLLSRLMAHISTSHPELVWDIPMQSFARKELTSYGKGALANVNFTSTRAFGEMGENVPVVGIFELSGATLFHGWVVDPQDMALSEALGNKSHDSLMVELGEYVSKMEGGLEFSTVDSAKWNLIHQFLHGNSLTPHGLSCLREDTKEEEVCVLLWCNHFSTMMKHNGELYLLQTDVGFLTTDIVWQRLSEDGCGEYMTCCFTPVVEEAPMTVFASENEHLNLEFLVNLRALIAHHMPNRINTFFQLVGKHILSESDDTKREWYLNKLVAELEQHEIHLFYQSACEMIRAESDNGKYLKRLMSLSNEKLAEITAVEGQIVDICKEDNALSVISILQMNVCVASSLGPQFFPQISHVSSDMLTLYSLCSKLIPKQLVDEGSEDGPLALELQCLRSVKMEILKLMETVVVKAEDLPQLQKQFILPLVDSVLSDYNRDTIEHGVLSLFSTIIIKFSSDMLEGVSRIFDAVFQDTPEINKKPEHCSNLFSLLHVIGTHCFQVLTNNSCERLNHVMDYIIWALKQREINIVETVLSLLLDVLQNVQASGFQNQFYKTNLFRIEQTILTVLMGMPNNSCSELHVSVLQHLFNAVDVLTEPLISSTQCNMMFVRDCTIKVLGSAFPGMTDKMAHKFVDGLFNSKGDDAGFLNHTRQFLAQSKETCMQVAQEQKSLDGSFSPRNDLADLCCLARDSSEPSVRVSLPLAQTAPSSATTSISHFGTLVANFSGVTSKYKPIVIGTDKTHGGDWTVVTSKRKAHRFKESDSSSDTGLGNLASAAAASKLFPSSANAGTSSVVPFTEFIKLPGNAITAKRTIFSGANSMEVDETTLLGRRSVTSYLHKMTAEHVLGNSWNGTLQKKDFVVVDDSKFMIWKPAAARCSPDALLKDYGNFASEFLPLFGEAALFKALRNSLKKFRPRYFTRDLARKFRFFLMTHLAIKSATIRSHFWTELGRVHRFLSKEGRNALSAALRGFMVQVPDWRQLVKRNPTLLEVYNYREEKDKKKEQKNKQPQGSPKVEPVKVAGKLQNYGDLVYNSSLESLLTFIRNCMQHLGEPGEDGKAKIKRLVEIDLLLSHILHQMPLIMEHLIFSPCLTEEVSEMLSDVWDLLLVTEGMVIDKSLFDA